MLGENLFQAVIKVTREIIRLVNISRKLFTSTI